jgi:hypothetical protein
VVPCAVEAGVVPENVEVAVTPCAAEAEIEFCATMDKQQTVGGATAAPNTVVEQQKINIPDVPVRVKP